MQQRTNYLNSRQNITAGLELLITQDVNNKKDGCFCMIYLQNLPNMVIDYGFEKMLSFLNKICQDIEEQLPKGSYINIVEEEIICIYISDCNYFKGKNIAEELLNFIEDFPIYNQSVDPIYFLVKIAWLNSSKCNHDAKKIFDLCFGVVMQNDQKEYVKKIFDFHEIFTFHDNLRRNINLSSYLHSALKENRLRLAFQPIVNSKTGQFSYYESLLRIVNSNGDLISAGPYIPAAEKTGLINNIDETVFDLVIKELRENPEVKLAFNISSLAIENDNLLDKVRKTLQSNLDIATRLILEITETAAYNDLGKAAYFFACLQDTGCEIALDDFGAGHSSFRQLKALPLDIIKIDGTFIRNIVENTDSRLFVKFLLGITKNMGLKTVAEFVENGEIAKILLELEVDYMQGHYFSPALHYRAWKNNDKF